MNACVDACVERGRGRRAGAHPDAATPRGRGSGGWAVGCLLSAALTSGGTAVKAAGGARPSDAVQTCAHPARDQPISRGTSTPLRRACFGPAGPDRACYGGKAVDAETGRTRAEVTAKRIDGRGQTDGRFGPNASKDAPRPDRPGTDRAFGSAITPWRPPRVESTRPVRPNI
jgi:hypothetical protein